MTKSMTKEELYENARKNSVGADKTSRCITMSEEDLDKALDDEYKRGRKKGFNNGIKKGIKRGKIYGAIAGILFAATIAAGKQGVNYAVDAYQTAVIVSDATEYGENLVNKNTKRTQDYQNYYYEEVDIALALMEQPENFDTNLFGVYKGIDYNVIGEMDKIIRICDSMREKQGLKAYGDWQGYCEAKGFVDDEGKFDRDVYFSKMKQQIKQEAKAQELQKEAAELQSAVEGFKAK